ncbi:hypothetical protein PNQ69_13040 [Xanthomonas sp. A2111]|uniref:Uncharacterized protein n=1 Tax=Xanthomonas hawaiiensis TaxID=3003247 RepID=A0ABU2I7U1_9XANT|nr:hypothetical protein [Xanthomonas sp. A2111]MDS9993698.1 hypothetical protein [Xanthomonas sp. A2111]
MGPLLLALLPLATHAAPDVPDSLRVSSTTTYAAGTPEWRQYGTGWHNTGRAATTRAWAISTSSAPSS